MSALIRGDREGEDDADGNESSRRRDTTTASSQPTVSIFQQKPSFSQESSISVNQHLESLYLPDLVDESQPRGRKRRLTQRGKQNRKRRIPLGGPDDFPDLGFHDVKLEFDATESGDGRKSSVQFDSSSLSSFYVAFFLFLIFLSSCSLTPIFVRHIPW